jgi:hypothetical protein
MCNWVRPYSNYSLAPSDAWEDKEITVNLVVLLRGGSAEITGEYRRRGYDRG